MTRKRRAKDRRRRRQRTYKGAGAKAPRPAKVGASAPPAQKKDEMTQESFETEAQVLKVDQELGLVFGWGMVCKVDGEDYWDSQEDHIPEDSMLEASADFMQHSRMTTDMHEEFDGGSVVFAFPLTTEIAKAYGIQTQKTGLLVAVKPSPEVLAKFASGEYTGFSIGGRRLVDEEVED